MQTLQQLKPIAFPNWMIKLVIAFSVFPILAWVIHLLVSLPLVLVLAAVESRLGPAGLTIAKVVTYGSYLPAFLVAFRISRRAWPKS